MLKHDTLAAQAPGLGFKVPRPTNTQFDCGSLGVDVLGPCGLGEFEEDAVLDYTGIDLG